LQILSKNVLLHRIQKISQPALWLVSGGGFVMSIDLGKTLLSINGGRKSNKHEKQMPHKSST
jgi:hypothetical protein